MTGQPKKQDLVFNMFQLYHGRCRWSIPKNACSDSPRDGFFQNLPMVHIQWGHENHRTMAPVAMVNPILLGRHRPRGDDSDDSCVRCFGEILGVDSITSNQHQGLDRPCSSHRLPRLKPKKQDFNMFQLKITAAVGGLSESIPKNGWRLS